MFGLLLLLPALALGDVGCANFLDFRCPNSGKCIARSRVCDENLDCVADEEWYTKDVKRLNTTELLDESGCYDVGPLVAATAEAPGTSAEVETWIREKLRSAPPRVFAKGDTWPVSKETTQVGGQCRNQI